MRSLGWTMSALVILVIGLQSCVGSSRRPPPESETRNKCADYNDGKWLIGGGLKGDITADLDRARAIARQIDGVVSRGKPHTDPRNREIRLVPTCEVRKLDRKDLKNGRFVAVLTGEGTARFSRVPNDIVYVWVFGRDSILPSKKDTVVHYSQFLPLIDSSTPIEKTRFYVCYKSGHKEYKVDSVAWHHGSCDPVVGQALTSHNPWFGCKLGCCFAAMDES